MVNVLLQPNDNCGPGRVIFKLTLNNILKWTLSVIFLSVQETNYSFLSYTLFSSYTGTNITLGVYFKSRVHFNRSIWQAPEILNIFDAFELSKSERRGGHIDAIVWSNVG